MFGKDRSPTICLERIGLQLCLERTYLQLYVWKGQISNYMFGKDRSPTICLERIDLQLYVWKGQISNYMFGKDRAPTISSTKDNVVFVSVSLILNILYSHIHTLSLALSLLSFFSLFLSLSFPIGNPVTIEKPFSVHKRNNLLENLF